MLKQEEAIEQNNSSLFSDPPVLLASAEWAWEYHPLEGVGSSEGASSMRSCLLLVK